MLLSASRKMLPRTALRALSVALLTSVTIAPAAAQVRQVDPNNVIDADLDRRAVAQPTPAPSAPPVEQVAPPLAPPPPPVQPPIEPILPPATPPGAPNAPASPGVPAPTGAPSVPAGAPTYQRDDLIGAAEGVFGRGAEGLAAIIEDILRKQGEPNAYIVGREAGGAFVLGVRYGSGTLHHRVEGQIPVYWTGPSIGIDAGANAGSTFVLVYNLYDTADLFHRYPAGEGAAYLLGGFNASYLRRGDVVLIPVRLGVGARLGVNVGYMRFSRNQRWLPF